MGLIRSAGDRTRTRIQLILVLGFGVLVALIGLAGYSSLERVQSSYAEIAKLHEADRAAEHLTGEIRSNLQLAAITNRDYLLDPEADGTAAFKRAEEIRGQIEGALNRLELMVRQADRANIARMRLQLAEYWKLQDELLHLPPAVKALRGFPILDRARGNRLAVMDLVLETGALTAETYRNRREEIRVEQENIPYYVAQIVGLALLAGIAVAGLGAFQIFQLEGLALERLRRVEQAEIELRGLSHKLVQVQEEERRAISRELHDQVGQLLTAATIGLAGARNSIGPGSEPAIAQLEQAKRLAEQALISVRDISMGLRPAMLDDLGLGPALEWQARQHSRLYGVPVSVQVRGNIEGLSDSWRTCIYRIVQEALNNVAKHAFAKEAAVTVRATDESISVTVRDDGRGFDVKEQRSHGLGLIGIRERVSELGGEVRVESAPSKGTTVVAVIGRERTHDASEPEYRPAMIPLGGTNH